MPAKINIPIGTRYGKLVVVERAKPEDKRSWWLCDCDCGRRVVARAAAMRAGKQWHCGCQTGAKVRTHGMVESTTYKSWQSMNQRCHNPSAPNYQRYGGMGISVCDRWRDSFENFLADMGKRPKGKTIDRYPDNNGNYEPSNCRWATPREQAFNRNNNRKLTLHGRTMSMFDWADALGFKRGTLAKRMKMGWPDHKILLTPVRPY